MTQAYTTYNDFTKKIKWSLETETTKTFEIWKCKFDLCKESKDKIQTLIAQNFVVPYVMGLYCTNV